MHLKLAAVMLTLSCFPSIAQPSSPHLTAQGSVAVVRGVAHVQKGAQGTRINITAPGITRLIVGFIPFGNEPTFRNISDIEGRTVAIKGTVVIDGHYTIVLSDPDQLAIVG